MNSEKINQLMGPVRSYMANPSPEGLKELKGAFEDTKPNFAEKKYISTFFLRHALQQSEGSTTWAPRARILFGHPDESGMNPWRGVQPFIRKSFLAQRLNHGGGFTLIFQDMTKTPKDGTNWCLILDLLYIKNPLTYFHPAALQIVNQSILNLRVMLDGSSLGYLSDPELDDKVAYLTYSQRQRLLLAKPDGSYLQGRYDQRTRRTYPLNHVTANPRAFIQNVKVLRTFDSIKPDRSFKLFRRHATPFLNMGNMTCLWSKVDRLFVAELVRAFMA